MIFLFFSPKFHHSPKFVRSEPISLIIAQTAFG